MFERNDWFVLCWTINVVNRVISGFVCVCLAYKKLQQVEVHFVNVFPEVLPCKCQNQLSLHLLELP